ncbi:MAG: hypothetical protein WBH03_04575 [Cyclobacteriaceae bacterium]
MPFAEGSPSAARGFTTRKHKPVTYRLTSGRSVRRYKHTTAASAGRICSCFTYTPVHVWSDD